MPAPHLAAVANQSAILTLRRTAFVLWRPGDTTIAPSLVIGRFQDGNPRTLAGRQSFPLTKRPGAGDLWSIAASACGLTDGQVYHYWFEVTDSNPVPGRPAHPVHRPVRAHGRLAAAAPRLPSPVRRRRSATRRRSSSSGAASWSPAIAGGETFVPVRRDAADGAVPNNRMVIYELPTTWTQINVRRATRSSASAPSGTCWRWSSAERVAANFPDIAALQPGRSHLQEFGVNALELLPPADSFVDREWGYATSNYLAPDFDLGFPERARVADRERRSGRADHRAATRTASASSSTS